ncbi:hypothetical protein IW261DRAFT_1612869 [Armillaria novae-zelandiae]|uniref:Ankyrin n=1 Tax=Armillaria novae-zelandiae TaxID=153914 RepID=A0AA39NN88_9AGAR|nr:hypothetical protein IW261DRAFT_1612869 [Armillaria novae-zelandiae]
MFGPGSLPIPSAPPYGDYSHTTPVVRTPDNEIAPPPPPLPTQSCARSHAFHLAIAQHDFDLVSYFLTSSPSLATPNTLSCYGNTPLFTAVLARDAKIARLLITHGADVNGWSSPQCSAADPEYEALYRPRHYCRANNQNEYIFLAIQRGEQVDMGPLLDRGIMLRTPLMGAASTWSDRYDDTAVAPDGQTALRLAATNKHRDITGFLPARRLGTFKRIQFRSRKAIKRIKVIAWRLYNVGELLFWYIPKFVLWTIPKGIWKTLTWKKAIHVGKFFFWKVPKFIIYSVPKFFIWKHSQISDHRIWMDMYNLLVNLVNKVSEVVQRFLSLLHTTALAIWTRLKDITLHDVWNAICDLARAIFMDLPRVVWEGIRMVCRALDRILQRTLDIGWDLVIFMIMTAAYITMQVGKICQEAGAVVVRLGKEIIVYFWPKAMVA